MDTEQCFKQNAEFPGDLGNWMADNNILCKILCIFGNSVQFTKFCEFCRIQNREILVGWYMTGIKSACGLSRIILNRFWKNYVRYIP